MKHDSKLIEKILLKPYCLSLDEIKDLADLCDQHYCAEACDAAESKYKEGSDLYSASANSGIDIAISAIKARLLGGE